MTGIFMLKYFKNAGFQTRLRIFIIILLVLLFSLAGTMVYFAQKNRILNTANENIGHFMNDMIAVLEISSKHYHSIEINDELYKQLKPVFSSKNYFEEGQVYLIYTDGRYLIHPSKEGKDGFKDNANEIMLKALLSEGALEYSDSGNNLHIQHYKYFEPFKVFLVISYSHKELLKSLGTSRNTLILLVLVSVLISLSILYVLLRPFSKTLKDLDASLLTLSTGELSDKLEVRSEDELGKIVHSVNKLIEGLKQTTEFSIHIGQGNLSSDYQPLGKNDVLGTSMLKMRDSLKYAAEEEQKRKKEDEERTWVAMGLAKFGDILRTNYQSTKELGEIVIQNLVKYLDANQGGIFQVNDDNESEKYLELLSAFAYDRKKYFTKKVMIGEGLIGACAIEKKTIYMTQVPQGYISITSGLGDANPDCLLIVPMRLEEKVFGVIEIASFRKLEKYEIEFVEKVAESIASTISTVKINARTTALLQQSQQQAEEMAAQEEEMRQNMEELQATQEESSRREFELLNLINSIDKHFLRSEYSADGVILSANELFINSFGFSLGELKGINVTGFIHSENEEDFSRKWKSICNGKDFQGVVSVVSKNGNQLWFLMSFSPVYDQNGELVKILGFAKSISNLKEEENELKEKLMHFEEMKNDWQKTIRESRKK
jgi:PAS domain S-box-containing protein